MLLRLPSTNLEPDLPAAPAAVPALRAVRRPSAEEGCCQTFSQNVPPRPAAECREPCLKKLHECSGHLFQSLQAIRRSTERATSRCGSTYPLRLSRGRRARDPFAIRGLGSAIRL